MDRADFRFSRSRPARGAPAGATRRCGGTSTAWSSMEYVLVHRGGRGQSFVYELLWDGEGIDGEPFLIGLVDVEALGKGAKDRGTTASFDPLGRRV